MTKLKTIIFYILCLFAIGCASKKSLVEKVTENKSDTTKTELTLRTKNVFKTETLCDPITGKAKDFTQITDNVISKITIKLKDNTLTSTVETDTTKQEVRIVKEYVNNTKIETITVYKTPKWAWWYMIIVTLAALIGWKVWRLF